MTEISRLEGEAVIVGDHITVTVLEIDGDNVLLRIESDDDVMIEEGHGATVVRVAITQSAESTWRLD
jgi:Neuraminidase (sialidase)